MKALFLLRVMLAFIFAGLSCNFSQLLILIAFERLVPLPPSTSDDLSTGPIAAHYAVGNTLVGIGGMLIAFGVLMLLLPKCSSSHLARIIAIFSGLSVCASVAFNFYPPLSMNRTQGILFLAEIGGTIAGALLAFLCIRFKAVEPLKPPILI